MGTGEERVAPCPAARGRALLKGAPRAADTSPDPSAFL